MNFMTYWKVRCTTQSYEIFRTSAGGGLKYEYREMFVLPDTTHCGISILINPLTGETAIWQFLGVSARTNVCAIILT